MFKALLTSLFAVALFSSGIIGSKYLTEYLQDADPETESAGSVPPSRTPTLTPELASSVNTGEKTQSTETTANTVLPTPFHGPEMSSAEIFRYASMNRKTMEALRRKEEQIRHEEMRLNLLNKDIEGRKREVEGILQQTQNALANLQQMTAQFELEKRELQQKEAEQAPIEDGKVTEVPSVEQIANIKVTAGWLEGMETADAAETLKSLANSGKMEFALRLLSFMEERKVAGILNELGDPTLIAELTEGFLEIKQPAKTKKR